MNQTLPPSHLSPDPRHPGPELSPLESDYLMVALFVRIQHLRFDEARKLVEAFALLGVPTIEMLFARAVIELSQGDYSAVLHTVAEMEALEPAVISKDANAIKRARMRSYLKARALFAQTGELHEEGRAALDFFLRHGRPQSG